MSEIIWQPAILAPLEHVLLFHTPRQDLAGYYAEYVRKRAGQKLRVRLHPDSREVLRLERFRLIGCTATTSLLVHPEDAARLFPESDPEACSICEHTILTD